jgi:hypothetical protein
MSCTTITLGDLYETSQPEDEDGTAEVFKQVTHPAGHRDSCDTVAAGHNSCCKSPPSDRISIGTLISECTQGDNELNKSLSSMNIAQTCSTSAVEGADDNGSCQCGCEKNEHGCCSCCQECSGVGDDECPCKQSGKCSCACCGNGAECMKADAPCAEQGLVELTLDEQIEAFEEQLAAMGDPITSSAHAEGPVIRNSIHTTYAELHSAAGPELVHKMRLALNDIPEVRTFWQ